MNGQVLQLLISVSGITVMVAICWALFGRENARLSDADAAAALARDVPGFRAGQITLSRDAQSALVENARDGAVYLAVVRGDGVVTRKLSKSVTIVRNGNRLNLKFRDFTLRDTALDIADVSTWEEKLKGLAA